ncbi:MAG: metalloregulator ArsR/SmtB family transcription factor [bacterium]
MTDEARKFGSRMFEALASPARLRILEALAAKPASVGTIAQVAGLNQPTASQHLTELLEAGIVVFEARGRFHIYRLRGPRIERILGLVEEFHAVHLDSLRRLVGRHPGGTAVNSGSRSRGAGGGRR